MTTTASTTKMAFTKPLRAVRHPGKLPASWWHVALVCLFYISPGWGQTLDAQVDRTTIGEGETLQLILTVRGADGDQDPDIEPLNKDFDVLGSHQANRIQIVNGRSDSSKEWRFVLAPKRTGTLTIPALRFGALRSQPVTVTVRKAASGANGKDRDIVLEASVDTYSPYVQAQVVLTLRLLHTVALREASLGKLALADAVVERLGDDVNFRVERDGKSFEGIERRYAVFPQRSGSLTIPPLTLTAKVPDKRSRAIDPLDPFGDPFNLLQPLQSIRVRSNEIVLKVRPPPPSVQGSAWLPATHLTLEDSWSAQPPVLRVGEPVTRTLTLRADGLTAAQLPLIEPGTWEGMKVYTDQPTLQTQPERGAIVGTSQLKWAVVPSQKGKIVLPEVRVPWWDTQTDQLKTAVLPARTLEVLAATASTTPGQPTEANTATAPSQMPLITGENAEAHFHPWQLISFALAVLWLVTLWLWLRDRRLIVAQAAMPGHSAKHQSRIVARLLLQQACKRADLTATRDAVLTLAASRWPQDPPRTLAATAARVDGLARDALLDLEARLYGTQSGSWNPQTFLKAIGPIMETPRRRARATVQDPLADLAVDIRA